MDSLYAYVGRVDRKDVAASLEKQFTEFVGDRHWVSGHASIVNHWHGKETFTPLRGLPCWNLGLKLELPDPATEPLGWFVDVDAFARFLGTLHDRSGLDFFINLCDSEMDSTVHLFDVSTGSPDLAMPRGLIKPAAQ